MWQETGYDWRSLFSEGDARDCFLDLDAAVLRSAAWTTGGMWERWVDERGEATPQEGSWRCSLATAEGTVCGRVFVSKRALHMHQVRTQGGDHGKKSPLYAGVVCNQCPSCRTTFSSMVTTRQHVRYAWLRGHCKVSMTTFAWPLLQPPSLVCPLCDFSAASLPVLQDHIVAAHLPKPAPRVWVPQRRQAGNASYARLGSAASSSGGGGEGAGAAMAAGAGGGGDDRQQGGRRQEKPRAKTD